MSSPDNELLVKLRSAFQVEAGEHLQAMGSGLLELEQTADTERQREIIATIFREAHSLKGAARAVNLDQIESICQSLESVFAAWRRQNVQPKPELFDPLHRAIDLMTDILPASSAGQAALDTIEQISTLVDQLALLGSDTVSIQSEPLTHSVTEPPAGAAQSKIAMPKALPDTMRISTAKLDALLLRAEELLAMKLNADERAADLRHVHATLDIWEREWARISPRCDTLRQSFEKNGKPGTHQPLNPATLAKLTEFLEWNQNCIKSVRNRVSTLVKSTDHDRRTTAGMVDALLEDSKKLLMLPCSTLFEAFPKLVRDLSRAQGKQIELELRGTEVEIDKRILEEMKDALNHLLRNAIDHGIEPPHERMLQGKPALGKISILTSQLEANKVEVVLSDDGAGIDTIQTKAAALKQGVCSEEQARLMDEAAAIELAFEPEVSTSPIITEISGRGLGLAIVKEKVERLGGRVIVESRPHEGTTFRLHLPLTLSTFRGIFVQAAGQLFVIPTVSVDRVLRIKAGEIKTIENRETLQLNGHCVSLVRLDDVLELARSQEQEGARLPVVVVNTGDKRIAFRVDQVIEEREVLVKRLDRPMTHVRNIAGATVLVSGKAVPILNIADLMKSAAKAGVVNTARTSIPKPETKRKSILVIDDSITARMLLKNIFESAGYRVKTAVDGIDGITTLKTESFDMVVSDVEMPRMNGFELTSKLRDDPKLNEIPIVLVTALAAPEDRERGIDVGADAYIVKSRFEQSDLLDVVKRLL